ncbi:hypothetical protein [Streptomyces fructofermentans]|uniref:Uncharacterized protein n=1 Tax=Streptomyces fructofermentans TaxID=152141 RepID=A0A918NVL7_9ACTN|nr:hypothetical protein [Streptomyces fructofermentans]GGX98592.1 hypothetical protein GCM10010515_76020 [Streptomyces fructofermentans]
MPMIVDPSAPEVTPPETVVSPDGWLTAAVDAPWAGVVLAVDYTASTPLAGAADVLKVLIRRQDPGAAAPAPVRSADLAWAVEGIGTAYDHEAPLGVAVVYIARPQYADGTWGPESSLSLTLPEPALPADVWIKSLDEPGLSARVVVRSWPSLNWTANIETSQVSGNRYPAAGQDTYTASSSDIVIDADGSDIERIKELLTTPGVRLIQTRADTHRPDMFVLFGDVQQSMDSKPAESRAYAAAVLEVARPDTAGQPMRMPGWSYDALAEQQATYDAAAASYPTYRSLAVRGLI